MSNVVSWKTATQIIEILKEENALVSGMSVEEAALALGYVKSAGGVYIKTAVSTTAEAVTGATASSVAEAATSTATTTATNLALYETSTGTTAVAGIGSIALPIASMIAASAGGYLIGNEIYKQNSDFLDKLMYPVYDFITGNNVTSTLYNTDNAPTVPVLFDADGNTFMPSGMVNGVKSYLDSVSNNAPSSTDLPFITEANTFLINNPMYKYYAIIYNIAQRYYEVLYSTLAFHVEIYNPNLPDLRVIRTLSGATTIGYDNWNNKPAMSNINPNTELLYSTTNDGVWYGRIVSSSGAMTLNDEPYYTPPVQMPTGVTKYTPGTSPANITTPGAKTSSWTSVAIPSKTTPKEMPEPVQTPDPSPNPEKITPYINPVQPQPDEVPLIDPLPSIIPGIEIAFPVLNPEPDTDASPEPAPDPTKDPSQVTEPSTDPSPVSEAIPDPVSTGGTPIPVVPTIPAFPSAAGLLHVYNPTSEQVNQFGAWLWTTFSGDIIDTISKLFNNPMDAVIGLHELYCTPASDASGTIRAGYLDSGVASRLVTSRYKEIKCGAISIPEFWGNYLDYSPYTKTYIYLPFIGIVELNADDIIGHGVEITYRVDSYNGSCIALITTAKSGSPETMTYQYSGNCAVELPITSGMKSTIQGALIGAATLAVGAATGGSGGLVAASVLGGIKGGASSKNTVQHSGSFGSSYGAMGIKKPYMIVKRPVQKVVYGYNEIYGYPSHKKVLISSCTGYLKAIEVDVVSSTATEEEKKMIEVQLKSGIFIS
jgi:hypothetical protein